METKKTYSTPELRVHGKIEDVTRGSSNGDSLDLSFAVHTLKSALTFS